MTTPKNYSLSDKNYSLTAEKAPDIWHNYSLLAVYS